MKKFVLGGLAGGIAQFFLGWLVYGILLMNYMNNNPGKVSGFMRPDMQMEWWALILGNLAAGFLLSYVFNWVGKISSVISGVIAGGVIGFLMSSAHNFIMYGTTFLTSKHSIMADVLAATAISAITGAIVVVVSNLGKPKVG